MVDEKNQAPRDRSPSFPYLPLSTAIEHLSEFYKKYGKYPARQENAANLWGLSKGSSTLLRSVAALKAFGLLDYDGTGKSRKIKISDLGLRILTDKRAGARDEALKEALQNPKVMSMYLERWGAPAPPKDIRISELTIDDGFTNEAARRFVKVYDDSIACAKFDKIKRDPDIDDGGEPPEPKVGDLVQWESGGVLQFESPRQVRAIQTDDAGQAWAFVVGSDTGIPMHELSIEKEGAIAPSSPGNPPSLPEIRQPTESEWIRGPLSKKASYRLIISGDLGPREISKLIRVLETQREILAEDDSAEEDGN